MKRFFQLKKHIRAVHIHQLLRRSLHQDQTVLVPPDDRVAATVAGERHQLPKEIRGEETGIAPLAVVAEPHNFIRLLQPPVNHPLYGLPPEQRLVSHQKQGTVAGGYCLQTQGDGSADACLRAVVLHRKKACRPGQL